MRLICHTRHDRTEQLEFTVQVTVFSSKSYDRRFLEQANLQHGHDLRFLEARLGPESAALAIGSPAICVFVNDKLNAETIEILANGGTRLITLRCAGFNNVDVEAAKRRGIAVTRVPEYSPYAVAEHSVAILLTINRRIHRAYNRVREGNFSIEGLLGFDLHGKTIGVVGTGRIGVCVCRILAGFGCRLLASDIHCNAECVKMGVQYVDLDKLIAETDVITLHCPLTPDTLHMIGTLAIERMKPGVVLINTSRGGLVDANAAVAGLKSGKIGAIALDVYEEEEGVFFEDLSGNVLQDDTLARLLTFPNVIITSHQAFFTQEAMHNIASTTMENVTLFAGGNLDRVNVVVSP
ncbi:D-lactate dehydrogenase [Bythopirellula goksoeyrii]|uniref:D-lactate dehydrogenase n=2 Tax=Bythopirellula goksoeyrii TaxID=1400387 RepID=A0A5B9QFJ9_9BACT|nr:D-lactate dehydrogenase [Bythopirellula goksoeyrii]